MTASDPTLVPILMYHALADDAGGVDRPFTVRPRDFAEQMRALRDWGATTIDVATYVRALRGGLALAPRTVVITVDDGYADTADVLAPVLEDVGFTATIFVTTSTIGTQVRGMPMITWPQIRALRERHFEIGAHGHHHVALDTIPLSLARVQMVNSRVILEQALAQQIESFAYPHGYWTPRLTRAAAEAGYRSACAAKHGLSHPGDDLYALSRVVVHRDVPVERVLGVVDGCGIGVMSSQRIVPRTAWRTVRRVQDRVERAARRRAAREQPRAAPGAQGRTRRAGTVGEGVAP